MLKCIYNHIYNIISKAAVLEYWTVVWSDTSRKNIKNIEKIQRLLTRYVFNYAEVDYKNRLLMANILPLTMRREYTDIVFFLEVFIQ